MSKIKLSKDFIRNTVKRALNEDLYPSGDITSRLVQNNKVIKVKLLSNQNAIVGGLLFAKHAFDLVDNKIKFIIKKNDGSVVKKGSLIAVIEGKAQNILVAERVALNFLSHISGIASKTNEFVKLAGKKCKICCTRKTIPNMRVIQKYAVKLGGGTNHRFNLSDEFLIKDNHIASSDLRELVSLAIRKKKDKKITGKGPVGKFFSEESLKEVMKICKADIGDSIFLACGKLNDVEKILSVARDKIARDLNLINEDEFAFCWIVDYPMYEIDEQTKKIKFSHNPFSMPQGDVDKLDFNNPLKIKAYQYDIVCNGIELSSGAIRNHIPELMYKLFDIAGYSKKDVEDKFSGMINALNYGAPPHGGIAPGIDRIVMLLANEKNIREVTMFPMNQNAQDLMMNAPSDVTEDQLKELGLALKTKR